MTRDGRVLAAHRRTPAGWEFPGGKVEDGEDEARAVERECAEELGVTVEALTRIGSAGDGRIELHLWHVALVAGKPEALDDHDTLVWLAPGELDTQDWLEIDRNLLGTVRTLLDEQET